MIEVKMKQVFYGPSPYASAPVVVAVLDIPSAIQERAVQLARSMEELFSKWFENTVETDLPPDLFIGRFLSSWSLAALNKQRGFLHEAGAISTGDSIEIWLGFHHPRLTYECLWIAINFFMGIATGKLSRVQIEAALEKFWKQCGSYHPDYQARVLMVAARHIDAPYLQYLKGTKYWQFGWGEKSKVFFESRSSEEPRFGNDMSRDKSVSKKVMSMLGVPVARDALVQSEDQLASASKEIGWPCVVKPLDGFMARGVTTDIRSMEELTTAFKFSKEFTKGPIMVESHVNGDVHRLLVVRGKLLVATRRECPYVVANGTSTVRELVQQLKESLDQASRQGIAPEDEEYIVTLSKQGLSPDSVAEIGRKVSLRRIPFQNVGGINTNVTKIVHRDVKVMAETLARSLGIYIAGLDYITEDISTSFHVGGAVVEINLDPALPPLVDDTLDEATLGHMVLGDDIGRIPLDLLLVKPEEIDDFANQLPYGAEIGWVCDGQIGIGHTKLVIPKTSLAVAVTSLLKNRTIKAALIIATINELESEGMPVDRVDRALLHDQSVSEDWLNVLEKHSGKLLTVSSPGDVANILAQ